MAVGCTWLTHPRPKMGWCRADVFRSLYRESGPTSTYPDLLNGFDRPRQEGLSLALNRRIITNIEAFVCALNRGVFSNEAVLKESILDDGSFANYAITDN